MLQSHKKAGETTDAQIELAKKGFGGKGCRDATKNLLKGGYEKR